QQVRPRPGRDVVAAVEHVLDVAPGEEGLTFADELAAVRIDITKPHGELLHRSQVDTCAPGQISFQESCPESPGLCLYSARIASETWAASPPRPANASITAAASASG